MLFKLERMCFEKFEKAELPLFCWWVALMLADEATECCSELSSSHSPLFPYALWLSFRSYGPPLNESTGSAALLSTGCYAITARWAILRLPAAYREAALRSCLILSCAHKLPELDGGRKFWFPLNIDAFSILFIFWAVFLSRIWSNSSYKLSILLPRGRLLDLILDDSRWLPCTPDISATFWENAEEQIWFIGLEDLARC